MTFSSAAGPPPAPTPVWERWAVGSLLALFVAVGLNSIHHDAFIGQDFSFHVGCTNRLLAHPGDWFAQDFTNRPLIYWIALDGMWLTGDRAPFAFAATVCVLLNAGALWLLHDCLRRCIGAPVLRVTALALVATLPVTLITTVVFAADAVAQPPFALLCWSLMRWSEAASSRAAAGHAALAGAALIIGDFAKFTFIGLPAAVAIIALMLWRWRRVTVRQVGWMLAFGLLAPLATGLWLQHRAQRELADKSAWHGFDWRGTGEMTWRSLVGVRATDRRIFAAPTYWERAGINGRTATPLLVANDYSYPALLQLGTFTDVLDFGHGGAHYGREPRPEPQQTFARWSVRVGLLFSLAGVLATLALWAGIGRALVRPAGAPATATLVWSALAMAWFLPLVLTLPFVHHAYDWGYWLPRLVVPALWGFSLGLFARLDSAIGGNRALVAAMAVLTGLQVWLQVRSVWF